MLFICTCVVRVVKTAVELTAYLLCSAISSYLLIYLLTYLFVSVSSQLVAMQRK